MKNEQKTEEMIEIIEHLQQYIPVDKDGKSILTLFSGDQLTCERLRCVKSARLQAASPKERFSCVKEVPGDWHALVTFYQVRICTAHSTPCIIQVYIIHALINY